MATRRPSDERPSSEERRARARAERRIVALHLNISDLQC